MKNKTTKPQAKNVKKTMSTGKKIAIGVGVAAAGAAAYALLGPNGKKNRAKVTKFADDIKKKVTKNKKEMMVVGSEIKNILQKAKQETKKVVKKAVKKVENKIEKQKKK